MRIVISSGHGKYVKGAVGPSPWGLDEVTEARRVVEDVAGSLRRGGVEVATFHDDTSRTQSENLQTIVDHHNAQRRDLDVSVHFNAFEPTAGGRGVEVLHLTQPELASEVAVAISTASGLINRGAKKRNDLYFLNATEMLALLIEVCFVDAELDVAAYQANFAAICSAIAAVLGNFPATEQPEEPEQPALPLPPSDAAFYAQGKASWFGGPEDEGVSPSEGLAFIYEYEDAPHLFLLQQPDNTSGLARRLNPAVYFVACRWDYAVTSKAMLRDPTRLALVRAANGRQFLAWPADWGPHADTGRVADLSKGLMDALCLTTDDEVEVIYPAPS